MENNFLSLDINITNKCNMRCKYCFEHGNFEEVDATDESILEIIYKIKDYMQDSNVELSLSLWGGEPSLRTKLINKIYNELKEFNITYFLYTNGLNISKEFENFLKNETVSFQISYDGKIVGDKNRIDVKGESTSDKVLENIKKLSKYNMSIKSTLNYSDIPYLFETYKEFVELNKKYNIIYSPSFNKDVELSDELYNELNKQIELIMKYSLDNKLNAFDGFEIIPDGRMQCAAGKSLFFIDQNGDILTCHGCKYSKNKKDFNIINILKDDKWYKALENYKIEYKISEACINCLATNCKTCNVIEYDNSKLKTFNEKWNDITNTDKCKIYKLIAKYNIIFNRIRSKNGI